MLSVVVFDLDGTLLDSRPDIVRAANAALVDLGLAALDEPTVARFVGDGAFALMRRAAEESTRRAGTPLPERELDALGTRGIERYIARYCEHPVERTTFMPGVAGMLAELEGIALAVCTNKPRAPTEAVLRGMRLDARVAVVVAGGDLPEKKPHPAPLLRVLELAGSRPEQAVMIGDGPQDVGCARNAGVRSIAVAGGFAPREALAAAGPDWLVDGMAEAGRVLRRLRA